MESVLGLVRHAGNDALFRAIEMSLLATLAAQPLHIHAEGLRGTGKTTIMRAVRRVLPRIRRIKGCLYNCDPMAPHCPAHRGLPAATIASLGDEWVPIPFLEISHSAKIGTAVGSIDLGRLVSPTEPGAALLPGTIPQAHRGIIFVDEINRLAETSPELADVLLDVMGTKPGRVQIEETGLPAVELPVQVSVWAASNPDEDPGPLEEIRRQLSDRFDFAIYTDRPGEAEVVERILSMAERGNARRSAVEETQAELWRTRLALRASDLRKVEMPAPMRQQIANLYAKFDLESLRAVQAIQSGVRLTACLESRVEASQEDLQRVAPMALRHRVDPETIRKVASYLSGTPERAEGGLPVGRSRFPGLSFGGMVAEPAAPAGTAPSAAGGEATSEGERTRAQRAGNAATGGSSQPSPGPRPLGGPEAPENWLRRTLSQLGLGRPGEPSGATAAPSHGATGGLDRFGPSRSISRGDGSPAGNRGPDRIGEAQAAYQAAQATGLGSLPNPVDHPPEAPPNRARPLGDLRPDEWIRTEEELGRP